MHICGFNLLQLQHLVLHEGNEGRDDDAQTSTVHWGELETQALPIAYTRKSLTEALH